MMYSQRQFFGPIPKKDYSTQKKALNECVNASSSWIGLLCAKYGMKGKVKSVQCENWRGSTIKMHSRCKRYGMIYHTVVSIGNPITGNGVYVDWTLRQFDSSAPYPAVLTQDEMLELWRDVDL